MSSALGWSQTCACSISMMGEIVLTSLKTQTAHAAAVETKSFCGNRNSAQRVKSAVVNVTEIIYIIVPLSLETNSPLL